MNLDFLETYAAVIAAVMGGVGVKVVESVLNRRNEHFSEATRIREELRTEIVSLREELEEWKKEADEWRIRYYGKVEESLKMVAEVELLRAEIAVIQKKFEQFSDSE